LRCVIHFAKPVCLQLEIPHFGARITGHSERHGSLLAQQARSALASQVARLSSDRLIHYRIEVEGGGIDIVAESFQVAVVWET
jgi:hypothetical protein